jgi:putative aldouronate transport system permease protein
MEESARMDGAGQFTIFLLIYAPVSKAVYAVILLFNAVSLWNNFFTSLLYTTRLELRTLQYLLMDIIHSASDVFLALHGVFTIGNITSQSIIAASVVIATVPILIVYPFLQKHFAKGVFVGSVKG